jgi:hypothetical protein
MHFRKFYSVCIHEIIYEPGVSVPDVIEGEVVEEEQVNPPGATQV